MKATKSHYPHLDICIKHSTKLPAMQRNATIVAKLTNTDIVQSDKFKVIVEWTNLTRTEASM